jgi:hypothetical protein
MLASLGVDSNQVVVRLWDTKTGKMVRKLEGPELKELALKQPPPG